MNEILNKYPLINLLNVSRETCLDFENYASMIVEKNKEINIVSKATANEEMIMNRHVIDSAQVFDFIDLNNNRTVDIGSGAGFPGIVLAIMMKNLNNNQKIILYEKSHHKSAFLRNISRKLNLNTEVIQKDIFEAKDLKSDSIVTRAFKPLPIVLDMVHKNFGKYKNLILFMGNSGAKILEETLKYWDIDFEKKKSITDENSFLLNIKNIKKKDNN